MEKNNPVLAVLADVAIFQKKSYPCSGGGRYWKRVYDNAALVAGKYQDTQEQQLCNDLLHAVIDDLKRREK